MKRFFLAPALVLAFGFAVVTLGTLNLSAGMKGEMLVVPYNLVRYLSIFWIITAAIVPTTILHTAKFGKEA